MKKILFMAGLIIASLILSSAVANAAEKQITYEQMFVTDCTMCHSEANARKIHGTKDEIKKKISEMQKKPGAKISDQDAQKIADFLWDPNRAVFEAKCTKCHTMERISKIHMKGVRAEEMQKIIETMCSKTDSGISPAEKKAITEHIGKYCTVK
jgi:cytochrome c5